MAKKFEGGPVIISEISPNKKNNFNIERTNPNTESSTKEGSGPKELNTEYGQPDKPIYEEQKKLETDKALPVLEKGDEEKSTAEDLEKARLDFVQAENEYNKYKIWTGDITKASKTKEREKAKEKYEKAKAEYSLARAELVMDKAEKFVDERMAIADLRAEKTEKSRWKKSWDWLGQQNLEKLGWQAKSRLGKAVAKGINLRTGISLGLLGAGVGFGLGSAVGMSALLLKRGFAGASAGAGTYELFKMGFGKYQKINEKKLESLKISEVETLMASYEVKAKLKGDKISENENYLRLKEKYLALIENKTKNDKINTILNAIIKKSDQRLEKTNKNAKVADIMAKITAGGMAAVIGSGALNKLAQNLIGHKEAVSQINGAAKVNATIKETLNADGQVPNLAGESKIAAAINPEKISAPELPKEFTFSVQPNESYIHEARKAIATYIHEAGQPDLDKLTPSQRVWAENKLWRLYQASNPGLEKTAQVGAEVQFKCDQVEQVLNEAQKKFNTPEKLAKLTANLKDFVRQINWGRYNVVNHPQGGEVYAWELDDGIKAVNQRR